MRIDTKAYGIIDIDERQKIIFPFGLLGFENLKTYCLMDAEHAPFYWLQSIDAKEIAFVLIDPLVFRPDYNPDIPEEELREIGINDVQDMLVFSIVTIPNDQTKMTANLQGPLLIARHQRIGKQCISRDPRWKVRHLILEEFAAIKEPSC